MNVLDNNSYLIRGCILNKEETYKGKTVFEVLNSITITRIRGNQYSTTYVCKKTTVKSRKHFAQSRVCILVKYEPVYRPEDIKAHK
jgi:hypothetical protein